MTRDQECALEERVRRLEERADHGNAAGPLWRRNAEAEEPKPPDGFEFSETPGLVDPQGFALTWSTLCGFGLRDARVYASVSLPAHRRWLVPAPTDADVQIKRHDNQWREAAKGFARPAADVATEPTEADVVRLAKALQDTSRTCLMGDWITVARRAFKELAK